MRELIYLVLFLAMIFVLQLIRNTKKVIKPTKEGKCREILEEIYKMPFPNTRPPWLLSKKGKPMELDCYNETLQLALEYNGEQHYNFPNYTNCSYSDFKEQQERDKLKVRICSERNIKLIVVPYTVETDDLKSFILQSL